MADILSLSEESKKYYYEGECPKCCCKIRLYKSDFLDGSTAQCPVCKHLITKDFIMPNIEYADLLLFADFNVEEFIKAFAEVSKSKGVEAVDDWSCIILTGAEVHNLTIEEELVRLLWKGIDAETKEYCDYVDKEL